MWGLRDLRHARVKKFPPWICLILLGPTTANIVQNLVSLQDQGIAVPQLTAGLVEAIPCEWYNYFKWAKGISKPVYDNTLGVLHLSWDLGGDVCQNYQSEGQREASVERPKKSSEPFRVGGRLARSWTNMALLLIVPGRALECANTIPYIFTIP